MNIQSNDFRRQWEDVGSKILEITNRVGSSGWYIQGKELSHFETGLANHMSSPYSCGVANGLNALEIAIKILGVRKGDKVLTSPLSAFATTLAIINAGAKPVFCDTDVNGNIDLSLAEKILSSGEISFFMPVHLYGNPINLKHLELICQKYKVPLIEDCAQAISASYENQSVGTVGRISGLSFYPTKNLGAMGDAGAILLKEEKDYQTAISLRDYGQSQKYLHTHLGFNSRLDEIHAASLNYLLAEKLSQWTKARHLIAARYINEINFNKITCLKISEKSFPAWHLFPIFCESKDKKTKLKEHLQNKGISTAEHYPLLIPNQPCMREVDYEIIGPLERAHKITETELSIPIHPYLKDEEITFIIKEVNSWQM